MPTTTLNIPVLVRPYEREGKSEYFVRPLFMEHPVSTHRRYAKAVTALKAEMKRRFTGFVLSRNSMDNLFWCKFSPEVSLRHFDLEFSIGTNFIKGRFHVAVFRHQNLKIGLLPNFSNFMFIVPKGKQGGDDLRGGALKAIQKLTKQLKRNAGDNFNAETLYSNKKEFLTNVKLEINIKESNFEFENEGRRDFFALFQQEVFFDGGEEIEKVSQELTGRFPDELSRAYYQDELAGQLYHLIFKKENMPLVLVGKEGTGRHTLIEEVIYRYMDRAEGKEEIWKRHYFWFINPNRIIAGMSIVGHWEKRFEAILEYVMKPMARPGFPDKILIDKPVALLRIGKSASGSLTLSKVLKPYLEKRLLQLVLLATPQEWKIIQESDRGFSDLFQVIRMAEPDVPTSLKIVLENRRKLEVEHECNITIPAISQLFTIQRNFLKNKALPGSIMRLLTQLATKYSGKKIDAPEVREEFKAFSGLEEKIFDEQIKLEKEEVEEMLSQELVGQPNAVKVLANSIHLIKAKLTDRSKPMASFLFIGPTGVGKTHAAKLLSKSLLGNERKLIRFDMNEYIDAGAVHRLIGDINNPEGQLTGKVRYQPFGVVLLDEIEKAHPKIHDLLLQVLDDARLTDSLGRTVDFSNTVIIMTSNLGAREAANQLGFKSGGRDDSAVYRKAVENFFRPELVNRIEQITVFKPLNFEQIQRIAQLQIKELLRRDGFVRRTTIVNVSPEALSWVAKRGFDARMGGRALKRQIEKDLTLLSAKQLIKTTSDTPVILDISFKDGRLTPNISPLEFCEPIGKNWLPELPDEENIGYFFYRLLKKIQRIERRTKRFEQESEDGLIDPSNWQYFSFKDRISQLKEDINLKQLETRQRQKTLSPVIPFRLKRVFLDWATSKGRKEILRDKFFQTEALLELREEYRHGSPQFSSAQTDYLSSYIDVAFLEIMMNGFLSGFTQKLTMNFKSRVTHSGDGEVAWLIGKYTEVFEKMDISYQVDKEKQAIELEGYNLQKLLAGEVGYHLFYVAQNIPVPISLSITKEGEQPDFKAFKAIRVYDGRETLTDLRTGYSNAMNLTADELKLLLYGGL
ncbi:MAG TPA: ATP-dependent Clp protease ATP-binding subunit [Bacteroidetes bacterium]|nr:ATP-dependent Clp protease ATP-binding subunit [Bacteroidota bacterium]